MTQRWKNERQLVAGLKKKGKKDIDKKRTVRLLAKENKLVRINPMEACDSTPDNAHVYFPSYQEPGRADFDGVDGYCTRVLTEAMIAATLPNWMRLFTTVQFPGRPSLEQAQKTLHGAALMRDRSMLGNRFNRAYNAKYRTIDYFFPEEGTGRNSGNLHFHGIIFIHPSHPRIGLVEEVVVESMIQSMVKHLRLGDPDKATAMLRQKQQQTSGKVVVTERCLNQARSLGYSMKNFDLWRNYISSLDAMPKPQARCLDLIREKDFHAALPRRPAASPRLTISERASRGTPPPGSQSSDEGDPRDTLSRN